MSRIYRDYKKNPGNFWENLVQFSSSVMFDSLWPHGLQHARLLCPSPTPGACSNSCPSVMPSNHLILCHPLLLLPSIFPSIRSFPMSWFFASGGQSIGVSASASVLPVDIQNWFPFRLTGLISLQSKGLSIISSNTTVQKHQFFGVFFMVQLSYLFMTTGKTIALTMWTFVSNVSAF